MMKVTYDPQGKYPNASQKQLSEACGLIPYWVTEWETLIRGIPEFDQGLKRWLDKRYRFGLFELSKSVIEDDGTYRYPGDPDMAPFIAIDLGEHGVFYQYPNAIAAIPTPDGYYVTRMD